MVNLRMSVEEEVWKKYICEIIQEVGREAWKDGKYRVLGEHINIVIDDWT